MKVKKDRKRMKGRQRMKDKKGIQYIGQKENERQKDHKYRKIMKGIKSIRMERE